MRINDTLSDIGSTLAKRDVAGPTLYFAGAAGSLAYGAYALINHLREGERYTIANIAKFTAPALLSSGLVYLGVCDLSSGRASRANERSMESSNEGGRGRRGRGRQGGRGRGRRASASNR